MENFQLERTWTQMGIDEHGIVNNNNIHHYKVQHILTKG
jgi:hypothetical protein